MEKRDLYDRNKKITGETILKGDVVPPNRYYLTVVIWIQNSKDEFLLQLTSPSKYHRWSATGGHPISGESSSEGIITEVKEELGIDISKEKLILFKTIRTEDDFVDLYYLKKDINILDVKLQPEEVEEVKWLGIDEIKKLIENDLFLPPHIEFFYECLKYLKINK